ncbi:MAG: hypothetical protein PUC58_05925 [Oscillospiraceae bacterium]|nr:hypothetical protein [Oscillospiraceae bacterium]
MKALSPKTLVFLAVISLLLTVLFTYLWASLAGVASTVFSVLVFVAAGVFICCINIIDKN